jgi:hypothetical protein
MNKSKILFIYLSGTIIFASCAVQSERKSAKYYEKNAAAIEALKRDFDQQYKIQPFSFGFTDRSYKHYVLEVTTDTLRYVYNSEVSRSKMYETITKFNYDTVVLRRMSETMKEIRCLWLTRPSFFLEGVRESVTTLSFRSVQVEKPFVENKYYILIFADKEFQNEEVKAKIKKGDIAKIKDGVYFMIGNSFR